MAHVPRVCAYVLLGLMERHARYVSEVHYSITAFLHVRMYKRALPSFALLHPILFSPSAPGPPCGDSYCFLGGTCNSSTNVCDCPPPLAGDYCTNATGLCTVVMDVSQAVRVCHWL